MPRGDGTGPRKGARGPRDGLGKGQGRASGKGVGAQTGGRRSVHPFPVKFFKALSLNLFSRCGDFDDIHHAPEFLCVAHYS